MHEKTQNTIKVCGACDQPVKLLGVTQQVSLDGPTTATSGAMGVTHLICAYHQSNLIVGLPVTKQQSRGHQRAVLKPDKNRVQKKSSSYVTLMRVWSVLSSQVHPVKKLQR